jgi:hypothetical protein
MGWMIELVVILVLTIVMVVTGATGGMAMEIAYMWLASIANIVWILVSSYIVSLRDARFPVTVIISIMTWSIPESMDVCLAVLSCRTAACRLLAYVLRLFFCVCGGFGGVVKFRSLCAAWQVH